MAVKDNIKRYIWLDLSDIVKCNPESFNDLIEECFLTKGEKESHAILEDIRYKATGLDRSCKIEITVVANICKPEE